MTELTEAILTVVENPTVDSFNKLINVLDDLCDENAILPVPGYYLGKEKGFTFAEVPILHLLHWNETKYHSPSQNTSFHLVQ